MNMATSARASLIVALFAAGAFSAHAAGSSCLECHTNEATMKRLVVPPSGGSAEGEG